MTSFASADFNPRIPYGMRLHPDEETLASFRFQSTHPVWDATGKAGRRCKASVDFNPRIPYGMRRAR